LKNGIDFYKGNNFYNTTWTVIFEWKTKIFQTIIIYKNIKFLLLMCTPIRNGIFFVCIMISFMYLKIKYKIKIYNCLCIEKKKKNYLLKKKKKKKEKKKCNN